MLRTIAAIVAASALAGCQMHAQDAGPTVSKNYNVGNFSAIEVAGPYDVEVRTGTGPTVSASGGEKLLERTVVKVEGDKLVIRPEENHSFFHFGWSNRNHARFTVTVPQLNGASIAGSGGIRVDHVKGDSFDGEIAGSGGLDIAALEVQNLKLSIAGSGGVKAGTGSAKNAEYEIAGSGDVDAGAVNVADVKVSIAGSGNIKAHATGTAAVEMAGSGNVNISGGAKCTVSKHGSGDVNCS